MGEGPLVNPDTTLLFRISRRHHRRADSGKAEPDISAVRRRPTSTSPSLRYPFPSLASLFPRTSHSPRTTRLATVHANRRHRLTDNHAKDPRLDTAQPLRHLLRAAKGMRAAGHGSREDVLDDEVDATSSTAEAGEAATAAPHHTAQVAVLAIPTRSRPGRPSTTRPKPAGQPER